MLNRILSICFIVHLVAAVTFAEGRCNPATLKTPALYFVHSGDEDKPFDPLVIATSQPGEQEIHCAAPRTLLVGSHWDVAVVKEDEFAESTKMLHRYVPVHKPDRHADFQYVFVSKFGSVREGPFSSDEAIKLFVAMAKYFERRQPDLQKKLAILIRRLGGPEQPQPQISEGWPRPDFRSLTSE
jgi:hypothetical protein